MAPRAVIVAGPNGSGKTTFANEYIKEHPLEYLSADSIAETLAPGQLDKVRIQAGRLFFQRISERIAQRRSFLAETTLAGKSFQRIFRSLQRAGFHITLVFVFLESPQVCIARVQERARKGGHDVPAPDVIRRFYRSINNFRRHYRIAVDSWHLVYNSHAQFLTVADGHEELVTVRDEGLYELFERIDEE